MLFISSLFTHGAGALALYLFLARGRAPRLAFWGALLTVTTDGLLLLMMGVFAFVFPTVGRLYTAGHAEALTIATSFGPAFVALLVTQALVFTAATGTTALAIARSGALPPWCGWAYALAGIIVAFAPPIPFEGEVPGIVLYSIVYARISVAMWRGAGTEDAAPVAA